MPMAAQLLKGVCCRLAYQTSGEQCVITALAVPLKEKLLVDNLDTVEVRSARFDNFILLLTQLLLTTPEHFTLCNAPPSVV